MNNGRKQRIQKSKGGHSNSDAVHCQSASEILHDDATTASRNPQRFDELGKIISYQNDI
jgi:hypothetical protein